MATAYVPTPSYWPDPADAIDSDADEVRQIFVENGQETTTATVEAIIKWHESKTEQRRYRDRATGMRDTISIIIRAERPRIEAYALAFVCGLEELQGQSITAISRKCDCTKAAISKRINSLSDLIGCRSRYQKSHEARISYRKVQTRDHWRNRPKPDDIRSGGTRGGVPMGHPRDHGVSVRHAGTKAKGIAESKKSHPKTQKPTKGKQ